MSRWVISKRLDDGSKCWAYVQDSGGSTDPSQVPQAWQCCDDDGQWRQDPNVKAVPTAQSNDMFVQLRKQMAGEMKEYSLVDPHTSRCCGKDWITMGTAL